MYNLCHGSNNDVHLMFFEFIKILHVEYNFRGTYSLEKRLCQYNFTNVIYFSLQFSVEILNTVTTEDTQEISIKVPSDKYTNKSSSIYQKTFSNPNSQVIIYTQVRQNKLTTQIQNRRFHF